MKKKYISTVIFLLIGALLSLYSVYTSHNSKDIDITKKSFAIIILIDLCIFLLCTLHLIFEDLHEKKDTIQLRKNSVLLTILLVLQLPTVMFCIAQNIISDLTVFNKDYLIENLVLYYLIFFIIICILQNIKVAATMFAIAISLFSLTIHYVYLFRKIAFTIYDIRAIATAADVANGYTFVLSIETGILLCAVLIEIMLFWFLPICKLYIPIFKTIWNIVLRMIGVATLTGVLICYSQTVLFRQTDLYLWNLQEDYTARGELYTFVREFRFLLHDKPETYSRETVQKIVDETKENNISQNTEMEQPENIIFIMNESLADFKQLGNIKSDSEILPFISGIKDASKGKCYVPAFGGGTCNSEYEALTGNNICFFPAGSIIYQMFCSKPEHSIVSTLKDQGYTTIAFHPSNKKNWNRYKVYDYMGFDQFISSSELKKGEKKPKVRGHLSDEAAYNKINKIIEEKEDGEKLFLFCVTMQNHGGYESDTKPEYQAYKTTVSLQYDQEYPRAETFLSLANQSDTAFKELIDHYRDTDEKTMIIMFGDHFPSVEEGFFTELTGKSWNELVSNGSRNIHSTPYVIWTNYDSGENVQEDFSSNYFTPTILQKAGLKLTGYDKFLLNLKKELPIISCAYVTDSKGKEYPLGELPQNYKELYDKYHILVYNSIWDRKNMATDFFFNPESD